ncbi:hypothetical protein [Flavobacterium sp.]|uniref:hypothetical protein n=1 Tax=Flavobacterium sp. TaxID=239 RepID=UPI0025C63F75|nr:hypothetical protein [Flavobacterium sp.]
MLSLILHIMSGTWMAYDFGATMKTWFRFYSGFETVVSLKLILLFCTFICVLYAQFVVIPNLNKNNIYRIAIINLTVTSIGVAMLILGSTLHYGGI